MSKKLIIKIYVFYGLWKLLLILVKAISFKIDLVKWIGPNKFAQILPIDGAIFANFVKLNLKEMAFTTS